MSKIQHIIFDLEATCDVNSNLSFRQETIEIGAVKVNGNGDIIGTYQSFVRPEIYGTLTDFCKELTGIKQKDVDTAPNFPYVYSNFVNWIGSSHYLLWSWGRYDHRQLAQDCARNRGVTDFVHVDSFHRNFAQLYSDCNGGKRYGMAAALEKEGLPLDGNHHRALDDAKNVAKIFKLYMMEL